ncbi:tRNA lysidine(34) synthetase TilS [Paenibacillus urinalis]|uniref:tRNA(Ile)-lysidine synthase n=1 Tax=Paenibacillus urinalis TaxID=521520 RepID=A0ABY7XA01_9BACL|nr:tRNA lysidine(34) synthetase TilS [Paenibacillus urinalis]WDH98810.1 tRNA lysidine(34) synthetase TilS [Paenibacillus urinalis]WDI02506.1 tRNA lysidine(34) synthetase TilS [Paenibacillus urinalis]
MEGRNKLSKTALQVLETAEAFGLWQPGYRIVVAVSGGADSVALLHILNQISQYHTPLTLICAHVHHGFRRESDQEAEMVREFAESLLIPFEMTRVNIPQYVEDSGRNAQDASREKRYEFLHQIAAQYNADSIALAHHADDQAETVLLHLLRGSGPSGLTGIKIKRFEKNVELIRPCLRINKTDLAHHCEQYDLPYVIDSSNMSTKYRRNAIRLDVLPFLGQYNGQFTESLNRLAEVMSVEDDYMDTISRQTYSEMVQNSEGSLSFKVTDFKELHVALQRRLIKLILNYLPSNDDFVDFSRIETIRRGAVQHEPTTWSHDIGQGIVCIREYDNIIFSTQRSSVSEHYNYQLDFLDGDAQLDLTEIGTRLHLSCLDNGFRPVSASEALFDANTFIWPLTIRSRLPGDTMKVMGLNGSKKVKDIFIDAKIPPSLRSRIPVICDGAGNIIWIPGVRRSIHFPVSEDSTSIIRMLVEEL